MDRSLLFENGPREGLRDAWGITPAYWLWSSHINILFVIDGRIDLTSEAGTFGLGPVLDTLRSSFSWWVRFTVHVGKRDGPQNPGDPAFTGLTYTDFRFTDAGFDIDAYDQIWFFGDNPYSDLATDADIPAGHPLSDDELRLVADWMERGGGVFAAGDHSILGASMCSRIPRVRTMRRWTQQQNVPTKFKSTRHQTLQPTSEDQFRQEQDLVLQPVEVVNWPLLPHPLLCSTLGLIDRFPDHMHEGEVVDDDQVQLDLPLDIPGYSGHEYPVVIPKVLASAPLDTEPLGLRPRPHVIAYGRTTNRYFEEPVVQPAATIGTGQSDVVGFGILKRFGLVSVYDGDPVGLGRVVVDSTWHHWFSLNLVGIREDDPPAYEKMQAYYRNVGMWLARPAQRSAMLVAAVWGVVANVAPMAFGSQSGPWEVADGVLSVLPRTLTRCMQRELVGGFWDAKVLAAMNRQLPSEPMACGSREDLLHRALVGGIGSALLDLALDQQDRRAIGQRPRLNAEAVRRRAVDGILRAHALLEEKLDGAASTIGTLRDTLRSSAVPSVDVRIPIDVRRLRIVAESLQFPDGSDPALIGPRVTLTVRIKLDATVLAYEVLEELSLPRFAERGGLVDLRRDVGHVDVQTGENLSVEVLAGRWTSGEANPDALRFFDTLRGDVSQWIGTNAPARSQLWRLWYRIEEAGPPSSR